MNVLVILVVAGFLIMLFVAGNKNAKEQKEALDDQFTIKFGNKSFSSGKYIFGHPDINDPIEKTGFVAAENSFDIYDLISKKKVASIPYESIEDISLEDSSTIEKKVTVGRVFLVGVFALAWKKKKVNELALLLIQWKDNKFKQDTVFQFEGNNAVPICNTVRNKMLQVLKQEV